MYLIIYIGMVIAVCLWDSLVGFGIEFDGRENPPLFLIAMFWFISIPTILIFAFGYFLSYLKQKRIERNKKKLRIKADQERLRIKEEKEYQKIMKEVEEELKKSKVY